MEDRNLAYAAGLLDGEGCILIAKGRPDGIRRVTPQYSLQVRVGMSVIVAVKWLVANFGGRYSIRPNGHFKAIHTWTAQTHEAERFLRLVYPYLKVKKEECRIALEFRDYIKNHIKTYGRTNRISIAEVAKREAYKLKLEELKRG